MGEHVFFLFRMRAVFCVFVSHARSVSCFHFLCFWFDRPESEAVSSARRKKRRFGRVFFLLGMLPSHVGADF